LYTVGIMRRFLANKKTWFSIVCIVSLVGYGVFVFAAAPSGGYAPGATLDPGCAPGDTNCSVNLALAGLALGTPVTGQTPSGQVLYTDASSNLASDTNFTRDPSTQYTNILATTSPGQTSGLQINDSPLGIPISGAALLTIASDGEAEVFAGNGTGGGLGDATTGFFSGSNSGAQAIITNDASSGISEEYDDSSGDKSGVELDSSVANLLYAPNGSSGPNGVAVSSFGTGLIYDNNQVGFFPTTDGTAGQVLTTNGNGSWSFQDPAGQECSGSSDGQVQYNNSGACTGDSNFTWDHTNKEFSVGNGLVNGTGTVLDVNNPSISNNIIANLQSGASFQFSEGGQENNLIGSMTSSGTGTNSVVLGDPSDVGNGTNLNISDQNRQILFQTADSAIFQGPSSDTDAVFSPGTNPTDSIGDYTGIGNKNLFTLDDGSQDIKFAASQTFQVTSTNGTPAPWLVMNTSAGVHTIGLGDISGAYNKTTLQLGDIGQTISANAANGFSVTNPNNSGKWLSVVPTSFDVSLGDISNTENHTTFDVDDGSQSMVSTVNNLFDVQNTTGQKSLNIDPSDFAVQLGDVSGAGNDTAFNINDSSKQIIGTTKGLFSVQDAAANPYLYLNLSSRVYEFGDVNSTHNASGIKVNDNAGTVEIGDIYGNNTQFTVNKTNNTLLFGKGTNKTLFFDNTNQLYDLGDISDTQHGTSLQIDDGAQRILVTENGLAGSVTSTGALFQVNGSLSQQGASNCSLSADALGNIICTPSDARLKTDIQDLSYGLDTVMKLHPVSYQFINPQFGTGPQVGFIAQEVQQVTPELVTQGPDYLSVNYGEFAPILAKAIQQLDLNLTDIQNFATTTDGNVTFLNNLIAWLGNEANGIKDLFVTTLHSSDVQTNTIEAQKVQGQTLCAADASGATTCITKSQLDQVLQFIQNQGGSTAATGSTSGGTTTGGSTTTGSTTGTTSTTGDAGSTSGTTGTASGSSSGTDSTTGDTGTTSTTGDTGSATGSTDGTTGTSTGGGTTTTGDTGSTSGSTGTTSTGSTTGDSASGGSSGSSSTSGTTGGSGSTSGGDTGTTTSSAPTPSS
jgi:endosialidase-like protein